MCSRAFVQRSSTCGARVYASRAARPATPRAAHQIRVVHGDLVLHLLVSDDDACAAWGGLATHDAPEGGAGDPPSLFMITNPLNPLFFLSSRITSSTSFI